MEIFIYLIIGVIAGVVSGLVGIGGGVIIVPSLIFFLGMTQHQAQGTTLGLLVPPIGILGAYTYYKAGYMNIKAAAIICIAFFLGSYFGAKFAVDLPKDVLRKVFSIFMIVIGIKMFIGK